MNHGFYKLFFASIASLASFSFDHGDGANAGTIAKNCNIFQGSWIFDNSSAPYDPLTCPFMSRDFACKRYGRKDDQYLKYKWQPKDCNMPRFDGQDFLKKVRGKKIMFVGDSLSKNAWMSLSCLLHAAVPKTDYTFQNTRGIMSTVTFKEYGVSVIYYHSVYLVDMVKEREGTALEIDSMKNGNMWKKMDMLIFNTFTWWPRKAPKQKWDYIKEGGKTYKDMDRMVAFRKGLTTWANWINSDIDPKKTTIFYQGISPAHYNGKEWNKPEEKNCASETVPLNGSVYPGGAHPATRIVNDVLATIKKPVRLLDITTLSQLRPDAHPSIHNAFGRGMDCTHWCIPGVPDTWTQLLYSSLI